MLQRKINVRTLNTKSYYTKHKKSFRSNNGIINGVVVVRIKTCKGTLFKVAQTSFNS